MMIFRKGGHLSVKEQWVFGHQRLEVVNSYEYLGFIFSAKLSFDVATNGEHLTRARRGTYEIIKHYESWVALRQVYFSNLLTHRSCPLCSMALNCVKLRPMR